MERLARKVGNFIGYLLGLAHDRYCGCVWPDQRRPGPKAPDSIPSNWCSEGCCEDGEPNGHA